MLYSKFFYCDNFTFLVQSNTYSGQQPGAAARGNLATSGGNQ